MANATRIMLVGDHRLMRAGLRALLDHMPTMTVVAEADDARAALLTAPDMKPDVILMELAMPGLNGIDATKRLMRKVRRIRVILLANSLSEDDVWQALRNGVMGYVLKSVKPDELETAVKTVAAGQIYLSPEVPTRVLRDYLRDPNGLHTPEAQLTSRQREILQLIAEGYPTKEIAAALNISLRTAQAHRYRLRQRLGLTNVPSLVRQAMRMGLLPPDN